MQNCNFLKLKALYKELKIHEMSKYGTFEYATKGFRLLIDIATQHISGLCLNLFLIILSRTSKNRKIWSNEKRLFKGIFLCKILFG